MSAAKAESSGCDGRSPACYYHAHVEGLPICDACVASIDRKVYGVPMTHPIASDTNRASAAALGLVVVEVAGEWRYFNARVRSDEAMRWPVPRLPEVPRGADRDAPRGCVSGPPRGE